MGTCISRSYFVGSATVHFPVICQTFSLIYNKLIHIYSMSSCSGFYIVQHCKATYFKCCCCKF